jgi:hypothetical protein
VCLPKADNTLYCSCIEVSHGDDIVHRQGRTRRVRIVDPGGFAEVLWRGIESDHGGNQSVAARAIGVSQPELSRLLNGRILSLRPQTLAAIQSRLSSANREAMRSTLLSPRALNTALPRYEHWLAAAGPSFLLNSGTSLRALAKPEWLKERRDLFRHVKRQCPEMVSAFHDWLAKQRHTEDSGRVNMAWYHILEPLLQWSDSGRIERDWRELSEEELSRFVKHGIEREKILLQRSPRLQRAQDFESAPFVNEIQLLRTRRRRATVQRKG